MTGAPIVASLCGILALAAISQPPQTSGRKSMSNSSPVELTDDFIGAWLNMIDRAQTSWTPQPDLKALPDGAAVQQDSEKWCGIFFSPQANPHAANPVALIATHSATADTADIIRYDYAAPSFRFRLYETVDFALLTIEEGADILSFGPEKRVSAVQAVAARVLQPAPPQNAGASSERLWPFAFPKAIEDGARFSTDESQIPEAMPTWASRVDGGLRHGHLYFLCFKKRESGDGRVILLNSHHWFDGAAWAPYRQPKRR
jgi:hypothetical protein